MLVPDHPTECHDHLGQRARSAPRVGVVTDRTLFAALLGTALTVVGRIDPNDPRSEATLSIVGQADLLVMDGELRGPAEVIDSLCAQAARCSLPILVVGRCTSPTQMATWVERGVGAFVDDDASIDHLVETARQLSLGHTVLGVSVRESLLRELRSSRAKEHERFAAFESLTKRERDVLRHLAMGISPDEVANASFVSLNTIRTQIRGILAKLDVSSVVGAVALAYRTGWLDADLAP